MYVSSLHETQVNVYNFLSKIAIFRTNVYPSPPLCWHFDFHMIILTPILIFFSRALLKQFFHFSLVSSKTGFQSTSTVLIRLFECSLDEMYDSIVFIKNDPMAVVCFTEVLVNLNKKPFRINRSMLLKRHLSKVTICVEMPGAHLLNLVHF